MINRSWLYVPADDEARLRKAATRGADALILDLEDGVAESRKDLARRNVQLLLEEAPERPQLWVRISSEQSAFRADLAAALRERLDGVVLAKTESTQQIADLATALAGMPGARRGLIPLIETAVAVTRMSEIAAVGGVSALQFGEADLSADLGVRIGPEELELLYVRQQAVVISAASGLLAPIAPVSVDFTDLAAFRHGTQRLARMGFIGRACIHPAQVAVVNEVFTPTDAEVERAETVIQRSEEAAAAGRGVFVDADGRMVDEAVVRSARRVLELHSSR